MYNKFSIFLKKLIFPFLNTRNNGDHFRFFQKILIFSGVITTHILKIKLSEIKQNINRIKGLR